MNRIPYFKVKLQASQMREKKSHSNRNEVAQDFQHQTCNHSVLYNTPNAATGKAPQTNTRRAQKMVKEKQIRYDKVDMRYR